MALRTLRDVDLTNKKVLVRVDFNVPVKGGVVTDDTRIRAALPTLKHILDQSGTTLILMSHLGRPKGQRDEAFSLAPVAEKLSSSLGKPVKMASDCVGPDVEKLVAGLDGGDVVLLENVRFYKEETDNDAGFAKQLASLGDVYVNDAFGTAHRAHASTEGVAHHLPAYAGFLIEKEIAFFKPVLTSPEQPMVAIIGGAKVSSKIGVLRSLMETCKTLVIGGGMSYTFLKVQGHSIGNSLLESDYLDTASQLIDEADRRGVALLLPKDHVVAAEFSEKAAAEAVDGVDIPDGRVGMDIGPKTIKEIGEVLAAAKTVVWNGPLGVFEFDAFATGTLEVARFVAECTGTTIVGGGDSIAAVNKFGLADRIDHVSTGGGASLEYLEGNVLPGIAALES